MARKTYDAADISISFDLKRCIHARNCFLKLPEVFDPSQRPWVQAAAAGADEIAEVIRGCPSGALQYERKDGAPQEAAPRANILRVLEAGPIAVEGEISVDGAPPEMRATLCRCGLSKTKPYCDYSHVEGGFDATGEPKPDFQGGAKERGGALEASRIKDGPLVISGNVEVVSGTGAKIAKAKKVFLCRCGASRNKPFCDGSHKEAGFEDAP